MRLNNVFGLVEVNEGDHIGIYAQHGADITKATFTKIAAYSTSNHVMHTADDFAPAQKQHEAGQLNYKHRRNRRNLADFTHYPETLPDPNQAEPQQQQVDAPVAKADAPEPASRDADESDADADDAYVTTYEAAYVAAGDGDALEADALKALQAEAAAAAQASLAGDRKMLPELAAEADYAARPPVSKKPVDQKGGAA